MFNVELIIQKADNLNLIMIWLHIKRFLFLFTRRHDHLGTKLRCLTLFF